MELLFSFLAGLFLGCIIVALFFNKKLLEKDRELTLLSSDRQNNLSVEFENTANKILKQSNQEFSQTSKKEIEAIIKPFQDKIFELNQRLEKNRIDEAKELSSLEMQVKMLADNNQKISKEANNLANAIKGDSKTRGNWGEVILERLLEVSGLQKDVHYSTQETYRNEENNFIRPDVVINMPNNRHIIIDSKVSLVSYEKFFNSEYNQENHLKEFIDSVKGHIKGLKSKFYQDIKDISSPDYVLMFIPVEASFGLLMQNDAEIFEFARKSKVLLVSPSTLLVTLKTIEIFWQNENQTRNVIEIAEESGKLYDKFVGLLNDVEALKSVFSKTISCFENINTKLNGRGGLIRQTEKLKELGAKTSKEIPESCFEPEQ